MTPTIALLTDFGLTDIYVGVMKGVMHTICPAARLLDITHDIQPQHVRQGAFALLNAYRFFAPGTIFLTVVDPGVGSTRSPIAVQAGGYSFVAPNNGILAYVLAELEGRQVVELTNPAYQLTQPSNTFHGRDIFAPAAAHLAAGVAFEQLGELHEQLFTLPQPTLTVANRRASGEVMHIDRFGNIVTSIGQLRWVDEDKLMLNPRFGERERSIPVPAHDALVIFHDETITSISRAYSDTARGYPLALVGSDGHLEIAVNQGNAATRFDVKIGDRVDVELGDINAAVRN